MKLFDRNAQFPIETFYFWPSFTFVLPIELTQKFFGFFFYSSFLNLNFVYQFCSLNFVILHNLLSSVYMQPVLYWFSFNSLLLIVWCFCEAYNFNFLFFCHNLLYIFPIFLINLAFHHNQLSYVYVHFIIAPFSLQYSIVLII